MTPILPRRVTSSRSNRGAQLICLLLLANAVLLWFGLTTDAITVSKTLTKEILIWKVRVVDERSTYSILTAIFKLWQDGNHGLFAIVFLFSIVFPIAKLLVNAFLVAATFLPSLHSTHHPHAMSLLGHLGKWSMVEVFMAALLCVVAKMGDLVRVQMETGIYLFCAAVILSVINAVLSARAIRQAAMPPSPLNPQ